MEKEMKKKQSRKFSNVGCKLEQYRSTRSFELEGYNVGRTAQIEIVKTKILYISFVCKLGG